MYSTDIVPETCTCDSGKASCSSLASHLHRPCKTSPNCGNKSSGPRAMRAFPSSWSVTNPTSKTNGSCRGRKLSISLSIGAMSHTTKQVPVPHRISTKSSSTCAARSSGETSRSTVPMTRINLRPGVKGEKVNHETLTLMIMIEGPNVRFCDGPPKAFFLKWIIPIQN